jgi:hypothetical protein
LVALILYIRVLRMRLGVIIYDNKLVYVVIKRKTNRS